MSNKNKDKEQFAEMDWLSLKKKSQHGICDGAQEKEFGPG